MTEHFALSITHHSYRQHCLHEKMGTERRIPLKGGLWTTTAVWRLHIFVPGVKEIDKNSW